METSIYGLWAITAGVSGFWLAKVLQIVKEPYLDEVFHVGQAQAYCSRQWHIWDPKITTPPGLYIFSVLANSNPWTHCSLTFLRTLNLLVNCIAIPLVAARIQRLNQLIYPFNQIPAAPRHTSISRKTSSQIECRILHTSLNISLFPVLFFFSSLYYTDVISTFSVLACYWVVLSELENGSAAGAAASLWSTRRFLKLFVLGLVSLTFRQTNIFWVTVFLGGLELVQRLKAGGPSDGGDWGGATTFGDVVRRSWTNNEIYDSVSAEASPEDYFKTVLSIATAAIAHPKLSALTLLPYMSILGVFIAFVAWNGSVVLGDKSNHMATLHLPQMLYIWPYMVFFSFPVMYHPVLSRLQHLQRARDCTRPLLSSSTIIPSLILSAAISLVLMLLVIHKNTIVHPFTLADNRHYVFYVFRWIVLRHRLARYLLAPVYLVCAWAGITALSGASGRNATDANNANTTLRTSKSSGSIDGMNKSAKISSNSSNSSVRPLSTSTSFTLLWLGSSALSLITAPLVEPRYFILPWLVWRLNLPPLSVAPSTPARLPLPLSSRSRSRSRSPSFSSPSSSSLSRNNSTPSAPTSPLTHLLNRLNTIIDDNDNNNYNGGRVDLWLETAWFLLVNLGAAYVFLYRGFSWPQEEGRVQRFLW